MQRVELSGKSNHVIAPDLHLASPDSFSNPFRSCAAEAEYQRALSLLPQTELDYYFVARALFTLGKMTEFEKKEVEITAAIQSPDLQSLFKCSKLLLGLNQIEQVRPELDKLGQETFSSYYIQAEINFLLGYLYNGLDLPERAVRYHLRAADAYWGAGLPGPLSATIFNLCVAYNHLNEKEHLAVQLERLEALTKAYSYPTIQSHYLKAKGLSLIDAGEYHSAVTVLLKLAEIYQQQSRFWDLGNLSASVAYCYLKIRQSDLCLDFIRNIESYSLAPEHQALLREWKSLSEDPFLEPSQVRCYQTAWNRLKINSPQKLNLLNVLAEKVLQSEDFATAIKICKSSRTLALRSHQAPHLCDFRPIEIEALIKMDSAIEAEPILNSLSQEQHPLAGNEQKNRRERLLELLNKSKSYQQKEVKHSGLHLDFLEHKLYWGTEVTSLSNFPLVEKFLMVLCENKGTLTVDKAFQYLYQVSFNPVNHGHRIRSLITRTRKILKERDLLIYQDGVISLNTDYSLTWTPATYRRKSSNMELRQERILNKIQRSSVPLSISDLESTFQCSRRTLQFDLEELRRRGIITTHGNTHKKVYSLVQGELR